MRKDLQIYLTDSQLIKTTYEKVAIVYTRGSLNLNDIVDEMVLLQPSLNPDTVYAIISIFNRTVSELSISGYNVNTGLVHLRPSVKGTIKNHKWDHETNRVTISTTPTDSLRKEAATATVNILGKLPNPHSISSVLNLPTRISYSPLTLNRVVEIKGELMKIAGDDPSCGIELQNTETGECFRIPANQIIDNFPRKILFMLCEPITPGTYKLSVTTQYSGSKRLLIKPIRITYSLPVIVVSKL